MNRTDSLLDAEVFNWILIWKERTTGTRLDLILHQWFTLLVAFIQQVTSNAAAFWPVASPNQRKTCFSWVFGHLHENLLFFSSCKLLIFLNFRKPLFSGHLQPHQPFHLPCPPQTIFPSCLLYTFWRVGSRWRKWFNVLLALSCNAHWTTSEYMQSQATVSPHSGQFSTLNRI